MEHYGRQTFAGLIMEVNSTKVLLSIEMLWQKILTKSVDYVSA
jgi:hypothetical protein